jgi:uncharacterized SAM-binding protein YcdF (DUF218 family)
VPPSLNAEVLENAKVVWEYHRMGHAIRPCDVLVVLCSNDLRVADYAVEVADRALSRWIVFTGGIAHQGDLLATGWDRPEAVVFAERAVARGLDPRWILLEQQATNTGENFQLSGALLRQRGIAFASALVVGKPFMERRAFATGRLRWPSVELVMTSPPIPFLDYLTGSARPAGEIIQVMVGDLQRIDLYGKRGFQIPQVIPPPVQAAYQRLIALGYDKHLVR